MQAHLDPVTPGSRRAPAWFPTGRRATGFRTGSSDDAADIADAAGCIAAGRTIGFLNRTVCALFGSSDTRAFADEVIRVKGEKRRTKPLAVFLSAEEIARAVDPARMPPGLVPLMTSADALRRVLAGLALLRLPFRPDAAAALPSHLLSYRTDGTPVVMTADPGGYQPLQDLFDACRSRGIRFLSGTSMNASGQPEIVDQAEGVAFSRRAGLPMFLADHGYRGWPAGSPTILEVRQDDVTLVRDGFVPSWAFEHLLGLPIARPGDVRGACHEPLALDRRACAGMPPGILCRHLLHEARAQRVMA